jgi:tRNA-Thr(GGU) m(6)t(6)A37 methyltransferase TsaA
MALCRPEITFAIINGAVMNEIILKPIGIIHSPFTTKENMPIQPKSANGTEGTIEVFEEFRPGLKDLDGFSHIMLIYHFHKSDGFKLLCKPFLEDVEHGVFAIRSPRRPNPIGLSIVRLKGIEDGILKIANVDVLDGTPLLDIKPYVPGFDIFPEAESGWVGKHHDKIKNRTSDSRFN